MRRVTLLSLMLGVVFAAVAVGIPVLSLKVLDRSVGFARHNSGYAAVDLVRLGVFGFGAGVLLGIITAVTAMLSDD